MEDTFHAVLAAYFAGLPVIQEYQNGPAPERPYVSYHVVSSEPVDTAEASGVDDDGDVTYRQFYRAVLDIQYHGEGAVDALNAYHLYCMARVQIDDIFPGVGLLNWSTVKPVPELEGIDWLERAMYSQTFLLKLTSDKFAVSFIETTGTEKTEE